MSLVKIDPARGTRFALFTRLVHSYVVLPELVLVLPSSFWILDLIISNHALFLRKKLVLHSQQPR